MLEIIVKPNPPLEFRKQLTPLKRVEKIVLHHMAHKTWGIHEVHSYHRNRTYKTKSGKIAYWNGIGYNYWIAFDGTIYEARGLNVGAHTLGWNDKSIGIGFQGDFESQEMTDGQLKAGAMLCNKLIEEHSLSVDDIVGHRDLQATLCPGPNFLMLKLKELVMLQGYQSPVNHISYFVQIGPFPRQENAQKIAKRFKAQGFKAVYIIQKGQIL